MSTSSSKKPKRANKTTSDVWLWFTKYEVLHPDQENNPAVMIQKADCKYCDKNSYSAKTTGDTSHLKRHMEDCKKNQDPAQTILGRSPAGNITSFRFNQDVARAKLVRFIVVDEQAFSFSEKDAFKRLLEIPHDGLTIANSVFEAINEYGISNKIFSTSLDNANSNDRDSAELNNWLPIQHNGQYFKIRCCCHIINLMVKDGLNVCKDVLENVRQTTLYLHSSQKRYQDFTKEVLYPFTYTSEIELARSAITSLFKDYELTGKFNRPLPPVQPSLSIPRDSAASRILQNILRGAQSSGSNELSRYLDSEIIDLDADFDILKWWKINENKYPIFAAIARDILAIPVSTVASEAAFSGVRRLITDYRSSLAPDTIEATMCLRDWYLTEDTNQDLMPQGSEKDSTEDL
ncbi:hypothetical protein GIB67_009277 [Kingdonia uniflora]|uniref:BED-type domain-containing protein n=1 Tax=Kingdonia uniflora TaxID=39325 RepID=A0A7J7N3A7_9MAGN|nr:hypothetical protein GIB67_009277 [Kingdonia uniflora]